MEFQQRVLTKKEREEELGDVPLNILPWVFSATTPPPTYPLRNNGLTSPQLREIGDYETYIEHYLLSMGDFNVSRFPR